MSLPFFDLPAGSLTVRLWLLGTETVSMSVYWGGDPSHMLVDNIFFWEGGLWRDSLWEAKYVSEDHVVEVVTRRITWHDMSERTMAAFAGSLESAVRDVASHHLVMSVMAS